MFIGQTKLGRKSSKICWWDHGEFSGEETEDKLTEGTAEEICKILVPLLKLIPGCENVNNETQEWIDLDEEQLTDNFTHQTHFERM